MGKDPWLAFGKSAAQVTAQFAAVPGLSLGVEALCGLIDFCEQVILTRNACRQLCKQCYGLLIAIKRYQPPPPNTLQEAFDYVNKCVTCIKNRMEDYIRLHWVKRIVRLKQMQDAIDDSQKEIADCFLHFQLANAADTKRWQTEFMAVSQADHEEVMAHLSENHKGQEIVTELTCSYGDRILARQEDMMNIMVVFQESMGGHKTSSNGHSVGLAQNLYDIQASAKILLPNPQLNSGEITDIEPQAVTGTASIDIFRGRYLQNEKVAIKVLRSINAEDRIKKRFLREVEIWKAVYNIDHGQHILPFYGFGEGADSRPFMVSPWQDNGNALSYVKVHDETVNYKKMITDIAEGLKVLHSMDPPVVHGDIRAENIFINSQGNPLIGDFGLSKMVEDMTNIPFSQSNGVANLYRWFAPEVYKEGGSLSRASDIYSFGMTVLELLTHQFPYSNIKHPPDVILTVYRERKPPRPYQPRVIARGLDDQLWNLLVRCWDHMPSVRPTIEEVLASLEAPQ